MTYGNDGYAPKSLPFKINILLPNDARIPFDKSEVNTALQTVTDDPTKTVLTDLKTLIETTEAQEKRGHYFALVLDTIWLRRCVYFVTLGLALIALTFPVIFSLHRLGRQDRKDQSDHGRHCRLSAQALQRIHTEFCEPVGRCCYEEPPTCRQYRPAFHHQSRDQWRSEAPHPGPRPRRVERSAEGWR